ncbi:hypothetical protein F5888DRAFT_1802884 [Russula emetica]|nr:hypothetical protein F5888DRAFT_1802884 [Russula emetica]
MGEGPRLVAGSARRLPSPEFTGKFQAWVVPSDADGPHLTCFRDRDQSGRVAGRDGTADTRHFSKDPGRRETETLSLVLVPNPPPQLKQSLGPVSLFLTTPSSSWKRSRRQKLASLRAEADTAVTRAEAAEAKNKQLEQALLEREQEIKSKDHRLEVLEGNYEDASTKLKDTTEKLRRADVDAEHTERQSKRHEQERDEWEKKYEEAETKYRKAQAELQELISNMDSL